ncbi:citrulline utilization hydrolase CtlX [Parapedobacter deserti]|uniref:Citrulline utilization hydrolase CtlX n=1 Tax=Parapedobacter deserti TaxID=1912957 RepID=A0ABV7JH56_9SPHI
MTILMIRPVRFGYNAQTAVNNAFQVAEAVGDNVPEQAIHEFDAFVHKLRDHDIDVLVINDTPEPHTPDSIFPNNWISFHDNGTVVLYPMFAENRRLERKPSVLEAVYNRFHVEQRIDYTENEANGKFLEGTGSMVLDRVNRIAYACRSPRTDESLVRAFCSQMEYEPVIFQAVDRGTAIYHTNVMMCVADRYAVIHLACIDAEDRARVATYLQRTGKAIVAINAEQMAAFAGNMLQVENKQGKRFLVMSSKAYHSLEPQQRELLESFNPIIHTPLETIERHGGGSARCMMAEVFLPLISNGQQR